MKPKRWLLLFSTLLFFFSERFEVLAQTSATIPKLNDTAKILFQSYSGWSLTICPNGSGTLEYGSNDGASLPAGTYDFSGIYTLLIPHLTSFRGDYGVAVAFQRKALTAGVSVESRYLYDRELIRTVMARAKASISLRGNRFAELFEKYPMPPDDRQRQ